MARSMLAAARRRVRNAVRTGANCLPGGAARPPTLSTDAEMRCGSSRNVTAPGLSFRHQHLKCMALNRLGRCARGNDRATVALTNAQRVIVEAVAQTFATRCRCLSGWRTHSTSGCSHRNLSARRGAPETWHLLEAGLDCSRPSEPAQLTRDAARFHWALAQNRRVSGPDLALARSRLDRTGPGMSRLVPGAPC